MATPDNHGFYRVRNKGVKGSHVWSTRVYDPERHTIHPGPASDCYGHALPPKLRTQLPTPAATDAAENEQETAE